MVGGGRLTVVSDKLESADYLSDSEEPEALGKDDTAGGELGVADAGDVAGGLLGAGLDGLGYGVGDLAGLSDALPSALVEGLEGGGGAVICSLVFLFRGRPFLPFPGRGFFFLS